MTTIAFSVANRAVSHLGRNLYGTTPPAIAELIANSYDAYARRVSIRYEKDSPLGECVVIADNGAGMSIQDLREKYATIGKTKSSGEVPPGMSRRMPMGRKGIGKLAAFSVGDRYDVYTKTSRPSARFIPPC